MRHGIEKFRRFADFRCENAGDAEACGAVVPLTSRQRRGERGRPPTGGAAEASNRVTSHEL
ncbi:hypothetical protein [Mycobacterium sp. 050134]|uniref:hypothetical protein n=1 Tax=Mycobacterium sp. 050134 TaxID=3096111 RepID=UPI002ED99099